MNWPDLEDGVPFARILRDPPLELGFPFFAKLKDNTSKDSKLGRHGTKVGAKVKGENKPPPRSEARAWPRHGMA